LVIPVHLQANNKKHLHRSRVAMGEFTAFWTIDRAKLG